MCEYCETEGKQLSDSVFVDASIDIYEPSIDFYPDGDCAMVTIDINYCPMCGRKLK
jgi:hypothetical protein